MVYFYETMNLLLQLLLLNKTALELYILILITFEPMSTEAVIIVVVAVVSFTLPSIQIQAN